jgi:mono/diheme cytochrome c family protein
MWAGCAACGGYAVPCHRILPALDVLWALLLIGLAIFVGGILLRRVPAGWLAIGAVLVVFGLGIPALVVDDHRESTGGGGGAATAAAPSGGGGGPQAGGGGTTGGGGAKAGGGQTASAEGKLIFTQNCGTCHTLKDAGTNGQVGPVLDQVKPDKARVLKAIKKGGLGSGTMPANIVTGKEAEAVAEYVSSVAGK